MQSAHLLARLGDRRPDRAVEAAKATGKYPDGIKTEVWSDAAVPWRQDTAQILSANAKEVGINWSERTLGWAHGRRPQLGTMINEGRSFLESAPWISVFPGIAIMGAVLAFNLLGDGLRDVLDPRSRPV